MSDDFVLVPMDRKNIMTAIDHLIETDCDCKGCETLLRAAMAVAAIGMSSSELERFWKTWRVNSRFSSESAMRQHTLELSSESTCKSLLDAWNTLVEILEDVRESRIRAN